MDFPVDDGLMILMMTYFEPDKGKNFAEGNFIDGAFAERVPPQLTDRQTDRQTDRAFHFLTH